MRHFVDIFRFPAFDRRKEGEPGRFHPGACFKNLSCFIGLILWAIPSLGSIRHVPADYPSIQAGIDAAAAGDTIYVAAGTYRENIDFKGKSISVTSAGGPDATIIDGGRVGSVVVFRNDEDNGALLQGFTLTNGAPADSMDLIFPFGGGVSVRNASPRIIGNTIIGNAATDGGGVHVMGARAAPVIENNLISKNIASFVGAGVVARDGACPVIKNNTICENFSMQGSAIFVSNEAHPTILGNTIENNDGGCCCMGRAEILLYLDGVDIKENMGCGNFFSNTILVADRSSPDIRNNRISGNLTGGIGVFMDSAPVIDANRIEDNHGPALWAGGLFVAFDSAPIVTKNTIEGNQGAALWVDETSSLLDENHARISLEGFDVIEDSNPAIVYSGNWSRGFGAHYSGGTTRMTGDVGDSVFLRFSGTGVSLIYFGSDNGGKADIDIDGVVYPAVDTFTPSEESHGKSERVVAADLTPGEHALTVTVSGDKNPLSSGYGISLDAVGVLAGTDVGSNMVIGAVYAWLNPSTSDQPSSSSDSVLQVPGRSASIQSAIEAAEDGDVIVVAPGTYRENIDFLGKRIVLRSGQPDNPEIVASTIIDAESPGATVLFAAGESREASLEGFTLRNGQGHCVIEVYGADPTISKNIIRGSTSGAIYLCYTESAWIIGNTIENNEASMGVINCFHASPMIENNLLIENTGSAINTYFSSPMIINNTIRDNTDNHGTAAAIYLDHFSPATLRGNAISRTRSHAEYGGCAIILDFFSNARIEGNIIADNLGDGIFTLIDSSPEVINNIISGNGGGLNTSTGHPLLINNTVVDNLGNGIYARDIANVTITNNIFSNDFEIGFEAFSHVDVTYSYVKGGRVGEGNISGDPMFVGDGDYRLEEGSPCIDAGASVNAPADDISGTTRPRGAGYDMGAYEYQVAPGPDIKANDQDGPISVAPGSHVSITVSLDPGGYAGQNADWWLVELAPDGHLYYFDLAIGSMAPGISPTHRGALFSLGSAPVFNVSNLTSGSRTFYFGVDLNGNGLPDMDALYYDGVSVNATSP